MSGLSFSLEPADKPRRRGRPSKSVKPKSQRVREVKPVQSRMNGSINSRDDLGSWLWGAADILRGAVSPDKYVDYVLPLLFYKRLSDVYRTEYGETLAKFRDEKIARDKMFHRASIPEGCLWDDVRKTSVNVGAKLNTVLADIAKVNPDLDRVINRTDFNNPNAIPEDRLVRLIEHFSGRNLANGNVTPDILGDGYEYLLKMFNEVAPARARQKTERERAVQFIKDSEISRSNRKEHSLFLLRNIDTIADIFESLYNSPHHGNKSDPVDELIYIHLSKKTNEQGYSEAFNRLSSSFPNWEGLADADPEIVKSLIGFAGLGNQRTKELLANIKQIRSLFGDLNLDQLRCWNNKKIFDFLTSLSGIGTKSALCIMMYSLKKQVFPVDTHVHTICERMGFIIDGLDHDRAQTILEEMFPKKLRFSLHVNMVAHGRKVCRKRGRPLCELCNLSKFCLYFRSFQKPQDQRYSMIDLFCGAGGASLGLKDAGFSIKLAIDNSRKATDTYYLNNEELSFDQVITCNIESLDTEFLKEQVHEVTLIFGGPPCQGWSIIGKNRKNGTNGIDFLKDQKNALYKEFARQLDIFKPRYFVMENVPALASVDNGKYVRIIKKEFKGYGYASVSIKLNASDFGVSQNRKRIFFIGRQIYLKEQGVDSAIKELNKIVARVRAKAKKCDQSFKDIIQDLPSLRAGEGSNVLGLNDSGIKHGIKPKLIFNHIARKHNERDLKIYKLLSEGEDYGHFSRRCKGKELLPYNTKSFKTKFRKINGNSYCHAIISHLSKDSNSYIHPYDERGITVREAARVQSFPDDFIFLPKGFSQFIYLGNAVPPKLARVIGDSIIETLKGVKTK